MRILENTLKKIQFTLENGLVFCDRLDKTKHISELYHIQEKAGKGKLEATAVLFRRKYNEHNEIVDSKPVLYIFYKEDDFFNSPEHIKLHAKIWSAGDIDVYFIVSKTRIDIFNARKSAQVKDLDSSEPNAIKLAIDDLCLISKAIEQFDDQRFSALVFAKGIFWEQDDFSAPDKDDKFYNNQLKEENTPFHKLLECLMAVRWYLHKKQPNLSTETVDKLLIVCILVKFLEDIKDDKGKHTLRDIYKKYKIKDFADALQQGKCTVILNELGNEFNGKIFDDFSNEEKRQIEQTNLSLIADFLRAKLDPIKKQYFLWEQYSFNYLPVELISAIYEHFLPKEKGVVYTPPFLVNFLIDEVMPLDKAELYFSQNQFKVLDPSCGSGVFLVTAYKRMLEWWTINDYVLKKKKSFSRPDKNICQEILANNIFGVDINSTATRISVFSLTIALLDKLEPKEIWNNLKLNSLQNNIRTENFFTWTAGFIKEKRTFDLVIGNPPFNRLTTTTPEHIEAENQFLQKIGINSKNIPGNDFALKFFEGALLLGQKICLILPSNVLLYRKNKTAQNYRNRIFTEYTVAKIYDFTHLRRFLFNAESSVCAVLAVSQKSQGQHIEHVVIKRLSSIEKKLFFEIDHYDRHIVPHDWATDKDKQFVWKTNLLGGGRLFHLIYRLSLLPTLKDFIDTKNNWKKIRGFEGGKTLVKEKQDKIVGITENGEPEIETNVDIYSDNVKPLFIYEPPFIIIDQVSSLASCFIPKKNAFTQKKHLFYNRDFIGISAPPKDENTLKDIFNFIQPGKRNNQLNCQFYVLAVSSSALVFTESDINQSEILSVPYFPEHKEYLELSETERILQEDMLQYYVHLGKAISEEGQGRKLYEKVTHEQLEEFGKIFCNTINPLHAENNMFWQIGDVYETPEKTCIVYQFIFGVKKEYRSFEIQQLSIEDLDKSIIFNNKDNMGAVFTRITRVYGSQNNYDHLILIKPAATRYWLNSIALHDADYTIWDYYEAGY